IVSKVSRIMKSKICAVHLLKGDRLAMKAHNGISKSLLRLKQELTLRDNFFGSAVLMKRHFNIKDLLKYPRSKFYKLFKSNNLRSLLVAPLLEREKAIGTLCIINDKPGFYSADDEEELGLFASQAAIAIENARLFKETKANYLNTMRLLASVIDAKDSYTEDHSEKVMKYALGIAKSLNLPDSKKKIVRFASILHDIGKINIDISILRKAGPLTKHEWQKIVEHPKIGAEILQKAGFLGDLIPAILYHHVKYEGGGYPNSKIRGKSIPIEARILAVADAFEAMTSNRPYRARMTKDQAVMELRRCAGAQFDPHVVDAFLNYIKGRRKI
ncbi:HD-GYP domain-containing protein, partial [Candidatus Omnitrophota bacterium]